MSVKKKVKVIYDLPKIVINPPKQFWHFGVMIEAEVRKEEGERDLKMLHGWLWGQRKGPRAKQCRWPLEACKDKERISHGASRKKQCCQHFNFNPMRLIWGLWPPEEICTILSCQVCGNRWKMWNGSHFHAQSSNISVSNKVYFSFRIVLVTLQSKCPPCNNSGIHEGRMSKT